MRLIIAEKPNLGRGIADVLGGGTSKNGYIELADRKYADVVTWLFGHMYHLRSDAAEYNPAFKRWNAADLPLNIPKLEYVPDKTKKDQIDLVFSLLKKADCVIHAGDPDREGQLLVDNILHFGGYTGKVLRLVARDMSGKGLRDAFDHLEPAEKWIPFRHAAELRGEADWRVGVNVSRALTCAARAVHAEGRFTMGRVQTPTLAIIVRREDTISRFVPKCYFTPKLFVQHERGDFEVTLKVPKDHPLLDPEGYLTNRKALEELLASILANPAGNITKSETKKEITPPPLCYSLTRLPSPYSAKETLEIMQSLYEKGLTTYPRTECEYMPVVQHANAVDILPALAKMGIAGAGAANPGIRSRLWDDAQAESQPHHAIVPTGESGSMSPKERRLFEIVCDAYVKNFYPDKVAERRRVEVVFSASKDVWEASGANVLEPGWTKVDGASVPVCAIPAGIKKGDAATALRSRLTDGKTSPPPHFSEAGLLTAMAEVSRMVDDKKLRGILREVKGIGTSATRPGIIEALKRAGYVHNVKNPRKKSEEWIMPTPAGTNFIHSLPEVFTSPEETAIWEQMLTEIASGKISPDVFRDYMNEKLPEMVKQALETKFMPGETYPCPDCGSALNKYKSHDGKFFWSCSQRCGFYADDVKGKPDIVDAKCPQCGKTPRRGKSRSSGKTYVACMNTEAHAGGKPVFFHQESDGSWAENSGGGGETLPGVTCPQCGGPVTLRTGQDGTTFAACMNKEGHADGKAVYFEQAGESWQPKAAPKTTDVKCPHCGALCREYVSKKTGRPYIACMESKKHPDNKPYFHQS